jgi:hypothetical protein
MKKRIGAAALVFCLAALLLTCENTVLTEDGGPSGFDPDYLAALEEAIIFSEAGLVAGDVTAAPGAVVTKITFPPEDGPWEAALVKGAGDAHNRLFTIEHEDVSEDESPSYAELKYSGDTSLAWGPYSVRIRIQNEEGVAFRKEFPFEVTLSPPFFKNAPRLYPVAAKTGGEYPTYRTTETFYSTSGDVPSDMSYPDNIPDITKNKNKLVIKWDKRVTATSYRVWVSKTENVADAVQLGAYSGDTDTVEMTDFPGETSDDDLPNNTRYWVWVDAANASGTTPRSPAATRKTSLPMQEYFYENKDHAGQTQTDYPVFHDCGGYGDYYRFTPTTAKYWFGTAGGYNYLGDVVYHETIDGSAGDGNGPFPDILKNGADARDTPAGVFVIKYREERVPSALTGNDNTQGKMKRYGAVYYWGVGETVPPGVNAHSGKLQAGIVNQWGGGDKPAGIPKFGGYAETVTYEEAMDRFTAENIISFLGLMPEPYYRNNRFTNDQGLILTDTTQHPCIEPWIGEGTWMDGIETE